MLVVGLRDGLVVVEGEGKNRRVGRGVGVRTSALEMVYPPN